MEAAWGRHRAEPESQGTACTGLGSKAAPASLCAGGGWGRAARPSVPPLWQAASLPCPLPRPLVICCVWLQPFLADRTRAHRLLVPIDVQVWLQLANQRDLAVQGAAEEHPAGSAGSRRAAVEARQEGGGPKRQAAMHAPPACPCTTCPPPPARQCASCRCARAVRQAALTCAAAPGRDFHRSGQHAPGRHARPPPLQHAQGPGQGEGAAQPRIQGSTLCNWAWLHARATHCLASSALPGGGEEQRLTACRHPCPRQRATGASPGSKQTGASCTPAPRRSQRRPAVARPALATCACIGRAGAPGRHAYQRHR